MLLANESGEGVGRPRPRRTLRQLVVLSTIMWKGDIRNPGHFRREIQPRYATNCSAPRKPDRRRLCYEVYSGHIRAIHEEVKLVQGSDFQVDSAAATHLEYDTWLVSAQQQTWYTIE